MTDFLKKIWDIAESVQLAIILLLLLVVDLEAGYFFLKSHMEFFRPLNDVGLITWMNTYGLFHLKATGWFFLLLLLLFLLAVNTFVCTTTKVFLLWKSRKLFTDRVRFFLNFSPHIIHYAFVIILAGYLVSYMFAKNYPNNILLPGKNIKMADHSSKIRLIKSEITYYNGSRMDFYQGRAVDAKAKIEFVNRGNSLVCKKDISINRPVRFKGYSIHLSDFGPKAVKSMNKQKYINLSIHKDPGIVLYFSGMFLCIAGIIMYVYRYYFKLKKRKT